VVAATFGNNVTFGSIPAGTKMIVLGLDAVSSNSSGILIVQLGDSGGLETSGYLSVASRAINANVSYTSGSTAHFSLQNSNDGAGITHSGSVIFTLQDSTNHCWTMFGTMSCPASSNRQNTCAGRKQLSGELTQLKFFNASGSFNAGSVNITYM